MTGPFSECQVRLYRDALTTPWGFRLQGGKDFKTPLTVQRVGTLSISPQLYLPRAPDLSCSTTYYSDSLNQEIVG